MSGLANEGETMVRWRVDASGENVTNVKAEAWLETPQEHVGKLIC